jgi:hypothetical protein
MLVRRKIPLNHALYGWAYFPATEQYCWDEIRKLIEQSEMRQKESAETEQEKEEDGCQ